MVQNKDFRKAPVYMSKGVSEQMEDIEFSKFILNCLLRYSKKDWGELCEEDKKMNDMAVANGDDRILASYKYEDESVYIITEWDLSATTILFAYEY